MKKEQACGYLFERVVWYLLQNTGYVDVTYDTILRGRGADHQIDTYGIVSIAAPFTYPIRLIAEVKMYKDTIGIDKIRNFLGVIIDISQNYISNNSVSVFDKTPKFTDVGCFFSTSSYSNEAQEFAWAHNIFLISFNKIKQLHKITENIKEIVNSIPSDTLKNLTKSELISHYPPEEIFSFNSTCLNPSHPSFSIGIIDNTYPVIITGKDGWQDKLELKADNDIIDGIKLNRKDFIDDWNFNIFLSGEEISFNISKKIANKLIQQIDSAENGSQIFDIDIPIFKIYDEKLYRRVIKVRVSLPHVWSIDN